MSEQMVPVLQSMQDYIEHHYLDEMMDEIEAVIDMEHRQHLNLGLEQQDDEVLRCVKLAFDRSAGKIVRSAFWRKDRIIALLTKAVTPLQQVYNRHRR